MILLSNPPPLWNFLGLWPPHPPGISNSLPGGGLDIFWNHTLLEIMKLKLDLYRTWTWTISREPIRDFWRAYMCKYHLLLWAILMVIFWHNTSQVIWLLIFIVIWFLSIRYHSRWSQDVSGGKCTNWQKEKQSSSWSGWLETWRSHSGNSWHPLWIWWDWYWKFSEG